MRQRLEEMLERWGRLAYRNAAWVILAVACGVAGSATQIPNITIDTSTEGFFKQDDPVRVAYDEFRRQFGSDSLILIALRPSEVFDLDFLKTLREMHVALEAEVPLVVEITSLVNARETRGEGDSLIVGELLEDWPQTEAALAEVKRRVLANPLYRDQLVSANGELTTILIETEVYSPVAEGADLAGFDSAPDDAEPEFLTGEDNAAIVNAVYAVADRFGSPDLDIYVSGTPIMNEELQTVMARDMAQSTLAALAAIAILLACAFRRTAGVILPLVTVALAVVLTIAAMAAIGIPITMPTQIVPSFLLAVGVGGSVHIMAIFYQARRRGQDKEDAIAFALGHSGLAVAMTSLTTTGGLLSFIAADLLPIAHFGTVAPIGVLAALFLTLVLLPALVAVFPMRAEAALEGETPKASQRLVVAAGAFAANHAGFVVAIWFALIVTSILGVAQVRLSHAPYEWFPEGHRTRVAADVLNDEMNGSLFVEFLIDAGSENKIQQPELLAGLEEFQSAAIKLRVGDMYVGKTTSISDVVQEIHQALNENQRSFYAVPTDPQLVAQELLLFENSGSDDLEDLVDPQFSRTRVTVKLPFLDAVQFPPMFDALRSAMIESLDGRARFTLTGLGIVAGETINRVMSSLSRSYTIAFLVICPLLVLLIGNLRMGLVAIIPNLAPILITLGVMGWFGLPLDSFTMMIGSIALGLAVDDTIHFMHNFRRYYEQSGDVHQAVRETLTTTGQALLFTTLVLASGFFLYWFATMTVLHNFGMLTALCIVAAFLADILLAPALMVLVSRSQPKPATATISMEGSR